MINGPWSGEKALSAPSPECRLVTRDELTSFLKEQFVTDAYTSTGSGAVYQTFGTDTVIHTAEGNFLPTGHITDKQPTVTAVTRKDGKSFYVGPLF